jgi:hypothetical protein
MRSYGRVRETDTVFLELKKKYRGVVYKRRISLPEGAAVRFMAGRAPLPEPSQIGRELDWARRFYPDLQPRVCLCYDRSPWYSVTDPGFRATFDRNLRWRGDALSLTAGDGGEALLAPGEVLMEIKIPDAAPLWLAHLLSEEKIFPVSFSKYGTCYREHILCTLFSDPESREALTAAAD